MSKRNAEYDFEWCPGCGDFGVRRALEFGLRDWLIKTEEPAERTVIVAGIGCSGNMVHLLEADQYPFGIHGVHGRTLPIAMGIKMGRPELNVVIVAGDGDFLSIGAEHIGPQAARNLDVTVVVMDNGVYGLTKGQSSPTTDFEAVTSTTPFGKVESKMDPLDYYLTLGVSYVANSYSSKVKDLAGLITRGMEHRGFSMVHVQSPCTTYNDTHEMLRGNPRKGISPLTWDIGDDHDPSDLEQARSLTREQGVPLGVLYERAGSVPFHEQVKSHAAKGKERTPADLVDSFQF